MQTFNTENSEKLKQAVDMVEEIPATVKVGVANSVEIAEDSGSVKFIASAKNLEAATTEFYKTSDEYVECGRRLQAHYANLQESL